MDPGFALVVGTTTVDLLHTGIDRLPGAEADEFAPESVAFLDRPFVRRGVATSAEPCQSSGKAR